MLTVLRWALAASVALALMAALYRGWWRRVPVFCVYLAAQLPLLIGYRPESHEWIMSRWVPLEPLVVVLRVGAAVEAFMVHCREDRRLAGLGLVALSIALVTIVWAALPADIQPLIVHLRRHAQMFAGLFLLLYAALAYQTEDLKAGWQSRHLLVLLLILLNHAAVSASATMAGPWRAGWWTANGISFGVAAVGYLTWAALCLRGERRGPRDAPRAN